MVLSHIVNVLKKRFVEGRQRKRDFRALSHLNAHQLRDIGLRYEHGQIVPLSWEATEIQWVESAHDGTLRPYRRESEGNQPRFCKHCGAQLT